MSKSNPTITTLKQIASGIAEKQMQTQEYKNNKNISHHMAFFFGSSPEQSLSPLGIQRC